MKFLVKMIEKFILIFCCLLLANIRTIYGRNDFMKNGNSYRTSFGNEFVESSIPGYVSKTNGLMQDFKAGKIQAETLNNFNQGFEEYYFHRMYRNEVVSFLSKNIRRKNIPDPFALPNYHGHNIDFKNVKVYGFPHKNVETNYNGLDSENEFKVKFGIKSGLMVFTSELQLNNSKCLLKYRLKMCNIGVYLHNVRSTLRKTYYNFSLEYMADELQHTCDKLFENSTKSNEIIKKQFIKATLNKFLPSMYEVWWPEIFSTFAETDLKYTSSHLKNILNTFVESAHQYLASKGLNNFQVTMVNYTNAADAREYDHTYKNIEVEGILNYVKFQLLNSTTQSFVNDPENVRFSDVVLFTYPQEGEKQAFVSFVLNDSGHEDSKKFKIKSIQVAAIYNASRATKDWSTNDGGFLIIFELDDFDFKCIFFVRHNGNDIARAFRQPWLIEYSYHRRYPYQAANISIGVLIGCLCGCIFYFYFRSEISYFSYQRLKNSI